MLNKTVVEQLNNTYIDGSYSDSGNTIIVNIETPDPKGVNIKQPFTIRTKDGYNLKYDENTGNVVYRINIKYLPASTSETTINSKYATYFTDYTFNLQTLSTYENSDPVTNFITPTYPNVVDSVIYRIPLFEYQDIEEQKQNIYVIDTGIVDRKGVHVYIASYYGKNPNKCKLELVKEVKADPMGGSPSYIFKTTSGKMYDKLDQSVKYGGDPMGGGAKSITPIVSISASAEQVGGTIDEDNTNGLFTTYIVNQEDLNKIANTGSVYSEIIINTLSYPIKFNEDDLLKVNVVLGNTPVEDINAKRFRVAEPKIKIFEFRVPYLKDVESCKLLLPFNPEIVIDYDIIRGTTISGFIQYEVSTNSSTLYISNEDVTFFKDTIVIETSVPYKPTGEYTNFKDTEKRLGKQTPTLLIKCLQEEQQTQFIQGFINYPITGILKDELDLLNEQLQKGVITNE